MQTNPSPPPFETSTPPPAHEVVSPLLSLIEDQMRYLNDLVPGSAAMLSAGMDKSETANVYQRMRGEKVEGDAEGSRLVMVLVTPEKVGWCSGCVSGRRTFFFVDFAVKEADGIPLMHFLCVWCCSSFYRTRLFAGSHVRWKAAVVRVRHGGCTFRHVVALTSETRCPD